MIDEQNDVERKHGERNGLESAIETWIFSPESANDDDGKDHQHIARRTEQWLRRVVGIAEREECRDQSEEAIVQRQTFPAQDEDAQGKDGKEEVQYIDLDLRWLNQKIVESGEDAGEREAQGTIPIGGLLGAEFQWIVMVQNEIEHKYQNASW